METEHMGRSREGGIKMRNGMPYARVRWIDDNGRQREKCKRADSKTQARQFIKEMIRELDDYGSQSLELELTTFNGLADYYEQQHLKPAEYVGGRKVSGLRSMHTQNYVLKVFRSYFGKKTLRSIRYGDLARFQRERINTKTIHDKQRSIATVNREFEVLRNMFNIALREGWILRNPFMSGPLLILKSHEVTRERIITPAEEELLLAACTGRRSHLRALIICALDTGMRRGEILTLTWEDVDFENQLIRVKAFNTKTQRERLLAMTPRLMKELLVLYEASTKQSAKIIFGIEDNFKKAFAYARKLAGLPEVRFHDLRHTAATRLVQQNLPLPLVGRILGHTQANTTMRYVNANVETARRAAEALTNFRDAQEIEIKPNIV